MMAVVFGLFSFFGGAEFAKGLKHICWILGFGPVPRNYRTSGLPAREGGHQFFQLVKGRNMQRAIWQTKDSDFRLVVGMIDRWSIQEFTNANKMAG